MKKLLIIIEVLLSISVYCQPQLTQFYLDQLSYNPAYAGSKYAFCANFQGKQQWLGFDDINNNRIAPASFLFNIHAPLYSINSGIGLNVTRDKLGFENNLGVKLDYAYKLTFNNEKSDLNFGLGMSLLNKTIDFDKLQIIQQADPLLRFNQSESGFFTDLDFGVFYQEINRFNFGVSINNIFASSAEIGNVDYFQNRNIYLTSGYYIRLSKNFKKTLYLIPSVHVKSNFSNVQIDLSTRMEYNDKFWGGISYRYQDAVAFLGGMNLNGFRIGGSYDLTIGDFSKISKGSPELFIGYCYRINPKVKLTNRFNTRYL